MAHLVSRDVIHEGGGPHDDPPVEPQLPELRATPSPFQLVPDQDGRWRDGGLLGIHGDVLRQALRGRLPVEVHQGLTNRAGPALIGEFWRQLDDDEGALHAVTGQ